MEQRWQIDRFMDGSVFYIEFNHREGRVTANHHLRKALQLATDSAELVYKVTKLPGYLPGESLFPVWLKGVDGHVPARRVPGQLPEHGPGEGPLASGAGKGGARHRRVPGRWSC